MNRAYYQIVIALLLMLALPACSDDPVVFQEGPVEMTVLDRHCTSRVVTFTTTIVNKGTEPVTKGAVYVVATVDNTDEGGLDVYPITKPLMPNESITQTFRIELHCNEDYSYDFKYKNEYQLEEIKKELEK